MGLFSLALILVPFAVGAFALIMERVEGRLEPVAPETPTPTVENVLPEAISVDELVVENSLSETETEEAAH